jgi:hypothetical protein
MMIVSFGIVVFGVFFRLQHGPIGVAAPIHQGRRAAKEADSNTGDSAQGGRLTKPIRPAQPVDFGDEPGERQQPGYRQQVLQDFAGCLMVHNSSLNDVKRSKSVVVSRMN